MPPFTSIDGSRKKKTQRLSGRQIRSRELINDTNWPSTVYFSGTLTLMAPPRSPSFAPSFL
jgi:hypothetical protein